MTLNLLRFTEWLRSQSEGALVEGAGISREAALIVLAEVVAEWSEWCHW